MPRWPACSAPVGVDLAAIPSLSTLDLVSGLLPAAPGTALPPVGQAVGQAADSVTTVIHEAQSEFRETLHNTFQEELTRLAQLNHP